MGKSLESAVSQLRKAIEKLGTSTEKFEDPTLMRFLIARSMDTNKAAKMFVEWRKWRSSFVPLGHIPDCEVSDELGAEKMYLQGKSGHGFPVVVVKVDKHFASKDQLQFKKFVVHILDKAIASSFNGEGIGIGNEKLVFIIDLSNISYKNVDARGLITGFQFLQAYYPERLAKLYFLHMPGFFVSVWKMVSYFVEKATLEKVIIVANEEEKKEFICEVGKEALPEEYGGGAKLVRMQDVAVTPWNH